MLRPDMATMLAVVTTDARIEADARWPRAAEPRCPTASTRLIGRRGPVHQRHRDRAGQRAGRPGRRRRVRPPRSARCAPTWRWPCATTPRASTKMVRLTVTGAATEAEAEQAARRIGESQLVKCSWYGKDPYWGRLASEAGSAGVTFDQSTVAVRLRRRSRWPAAASPWSSTPTTDAALAAYMEQRHIEPTVDLGVGDASWTAADQRPDPRVRRREHGDELMVDRSAASSARASGPRCSPRPCPYLKRCRDKVVVVKYGGNAMTSTRAGRRSSPRTSCCMHSVGLRPVVVHGGGPQIGELMAPAGQGERVPRRPPGHRRRDARHRPDGAGGQGQPRDRRPSSTSTVRSPSVSPARTPGLIEASAQHPDLGFVGQVEQIDPAIVAAAPGRGPGPGHLHHRRRPGRPGLQHQRRHRRRRTWPRRSGPRRSST